MRQVRWTGVQAGVPGGQRGHDSTQGIHRCARPCESGDTCVSSLVSFHLYQLKKRKRTWLFVFYASPVCRCTLSVAACVTSHVSVLCMCALGTLSTTGKWQLHALAWAETWVPRLGLQWSGKREPWSCWRRWLLVIPL